MATFKKGDMVFVIEDGFQKRMTVKCVHEYEVDCEYNGSIEAFDETDLTFDGITLEDGQVWSSDNLYLLVTRPGLTKEQLQNGKYLGEAYIAHAGQKPTMHGDLYEFDEETWIVTSEGKIYHAQQESDRSYVFRANREAFAATLEQI